jgi:hypothetical protein
MTDAEFEALNAECQRILQSGRRLPPDLLRRRAGCRDCERPDPEGYMIKGDLWAEARGRGCLCLSCLTKRLGRPLVREDFVTQPFNEETGEEIYPG